MTGIEYVAGMILLMLGLNLGYHEAKRGLSLSDIKRFLRERSRKAQDNDG